MIRYVAPVMMLVLFLAVNRNSSVKELCPAYNALNYAGLQRK